MISQALKVFVPAHSWKALLTPSASRLIPLHKNEKSTAFKTP